MGENNYLSEKSYMNGVFGLVWSGVVWEGEISLADVVCLFIYY